MRWEVTLCRRHGRRLGKQEPRDTAIGELSVELLPQRTGHRPRAALLIERVSRGPVQTNRQLLPSLLDPKLIALHADAMTLSGIEVVHNGTGGPVHEHVQVGVAD